MQGGILILVLLPLPQEKFYDDKDKDKICRITI